MNMIYRLQSTTGRSYRRLGTAAIVIVVLPPILPVLQVRAQTKKEGVVEEVAKGQPAWESFRSDEKVRPRIRPKLKTPDDERLQNWCGNPNKRRER